MTTHATESGPPGGLTIEPHPIGAAVARINAALWPTPAPEAPAKPRRVQLSRRKGWRMPLNTVKVSRPTKWGNPFRVTFDRTEADCAIAFSTWLRVETAHAGIPERRQWMLDHLHELRGKNLACWCRHGAMCHADVLLELANAESEALT